EPERGELRIILRLVRRFVVKIRIRAYAVGGSWRRIRPDAATDRAWVARPSCGKRPSPSCSFARGPERFRTDPMPCHADCDGPAGPATAGNQRRTRLERGFVSASGSRIVVR